jgi:hypothetical protein
LNVRVEAKGLAARTLEKVAPGAPLVVVLERGRALDGVVREAATARPVAGARVRASEQDPGVALPGWEAGAGRVETTSDAEGRFRLEGLGTKPVSVSASASGIGQGSKGDARPGSRVELLLLPGGSISGTVLAATGRPVDGAIVRAEREGRGSWTRTGSTEKTDAAGRFEIVGSRPASTRSSPATRTPASVPPCPCPSKPTANRAPTSSSRPAWR